MYSTCIYNLLVKVEKYNNKQILRLTEEIIKLQKKINKKKHKKNVAKRKQHLQQTFYIHTYQFLLWKNSATISVAPLFTTLSNFSNSLNPLRHQQNYWR